MHFYFRVQHIQTQALAVQAQTLKRSTDQVQMSEHFISECSIYCRSCAVRPLIREACLAARLLHQPSMQPPLQSNQAFLLDGQGPSGYASRLSIQAVLKLCNKAQATIQSMLQLCSSHTHDIIWSWQLQTQARPLGVGGDWMWQHGTRFASCGRVSLTDGSCHAVHGWECANNNSTRQCSTLATLTTAC